MKPIAIIQNKKIFDHSTNWAYKWIEICDREGIPYEVVDGFNPEFINRCTMYSCVLWHFGNYVPVEMMETRNILYAVRKKGVPVFPDFNTAYHFDDKIAEMYILQAVGASIPLSKAFFVKEDCLNFLANANYPLIAKLKSGSGASNVKKLDSFSAARRYAKRMFGKGYNPAPSLVYKSFSKIQSTHDWKTFVSRFKRIPEFLRTRRNGKHLPVERGYCYFQEFIPNNSYDIKVVVVNNKLSYFCRKTRKGDFRASGGGDFYFDRSLVTQAVIDVAFQAYDAIGLQCVGFDFVVDSRNGKPVIIEMSYGFDCDAVKDAGCFWTRTGECVEEILDVPREILRVLLGV